MRHFPDAISYVRLTEVPLDVIERHMRDPRIVRHLPLLIGGWDQNRTADFVSAKEKYWERDGLGHHAILYGGAYAGWGGFQKEDGEWDFGLVLKPEFFGIGRTIIEDAIAFARADERIPFVTFLLPLSRIGMKSLRRLGATYVRDLEYDGVLFRKFRLDTGTTITR